MRVTFELGTAPPFTVIAPPAVKGEVFEVVSPGSAPRPLIRAAVAERVKGGLVSNGHGYDGGGGASPAGNLDSAQFVGTIPGGGHVTLATPPPGIGRTLLPRR